MVTLFLIEVFRGIAQSDARHAGRMFIEKANQFLPVLVTCKSERPAIRLVDQGFVGS